MLVCLALNDVAITHETQEIGDLIIALAERRIDDGGLADWLRGRV